MTRSFSLVLIRTAYAAAMCIASIRAEVASPEFSPSASSSVLAMDLEVTCHTPDAEIRYTLDGAEPTRSHPEIANGEKIRLTKTTTIKARAWAGNESSEVKSQRILVTGAVVSGYQHALAMSVGGRLWSWGNRGSGRLGNGILTSGDVLIPSDVKITPTEIFAGAALAAAGYDHSVVIDQSGRVWAFGENSSGQLGNNGTDDSAYPTPVIMGPGGDPLVECWDVDAGEKFSIALKSSGEVLSWGVQSTGRLGNGVNGSSSRAYAGSVKRGDLTDYPPLTNIDGVAAGNSFGYAREANDSDIPTGGGRVWSWGHNHVGQLGHGGTDTTTRALPVKLNASALLTDVVDVDAGEAHGVFLRWKSGDPSLEGSVWSVGKSDEGRLGNGVLSGGSVAYPVFAIKDDGTPLTEIIQVSAGAAHTLALDRNGTVWAWGHNQYGQLGSGNTAHCAYARRVKDSEGSGFLNHIVYVSAGGDGTQGSSMAIDEGGRIWVWGRNDHGQLGNGSSSPVTVLPVAHTQNHISIGSPAVSISCNVLDNLAPGAVKVTCEPSHSGHEGGEGIAAVNIYCDGRAVAALYRSPWEAVVSDLKTGTHTIYAVVSDRSGQIAVSEESDIEIFTDPNEDDDGDGLTNAKEIEIGTDPQTRDTDGDGMSDGFESWHQFSPLVIEVGAKGPNGDFDGDGKSNLTEANLGRTATLRNEYFNIDPNAGPDGMLAKWYASRGFWYTVQYSEDLMNWTTYPVGFLGLNAEISVDVAAWYAAPMPPRLFVRLNWGPENTEDIDNDGLPAKLEIQLGLDPTRFDTDADGIWDGDEDYDDDGHSNLVESDPDVASDPAINEPFADRDGRNLQVAADNVLARWDFEGGGANSTELVSTPASGVKSAGVIQIANTSTGWEGADQWPEPVSGIPWNCLHFPNVEAYAVVPHNKIGALSQTWSMWIRFKQPTINSGVEPVGVLDTSKGKRVLFAIGKDYRVNPFLACYFDGNNSDASSDNVFRISTWNQLAETKLAEWPTPAAIDDGKWHHIAVHFNGKADGKGYYQFWFDGVESSPKAQNGLYTHAFNGDYRYAYIGRLKASVTHEGLQATIDRLRIYNKPFNNAIGTRWEASDLYNQDIDGDGLFDRYEIRNRFWRDHDEDGIREQSETTYPVSPFRFDPVGSDHDDDGLTTHLEQTLGSDPFDPDSDGDLLTDKWEYDHRHLNYDLNRAEYNITRDADHDGLSDYDEAIWGTNPMDPDSDDDGVPDGSEVNGVGDGGTSSPNDPSDGGQPTPEDEVVALRIKVGDQSSSQSEDYVVVCYRVDPRTGTETHHYTVRSGGHGEFSDEVHNVFRKNQMYSFKLEWRGSNNKGGANDGPDYDYTFKVEAEGDIDGVILDAWDKEKSTYNSSEKIMGEEVNDAVSDEEGFRKKFGEKRVVLAPIIVRVTPDFVEDEDETFRHPVTGGPFPIVASIGVIGIKSASPSCINWAESGSVEWDIAAGSGASLSSNESEISKGAAVVNLSGNRLPSGPIKVRAKIKELAFKPMGVGSETKEAEDPSGQAESIAIRFVAGPPGKITMDRTSQIKGADGFSQSAFTATVTDEFDNPVEDGSPVSWLSEGGGEYVYTQSETTDGKASAIYQSDILTGIANLIIQSGSVLEEAAADVRFENVSIQLSSAKTQLDIDSGETATITATISSAGGIPDGTPVHWWTSAGEIVGGEVTAGGTATATLRSTGAKENIAPGVLVRCSIGNNIADKRFQFIRTSGFTVRLERSLLINVVDINKIVKTYPITVSTDLSSYSIDIPNGTAADLDCGWENFGAEIDLSFLYDGVPGGGYMELLPDPNVTVVGPDLYKVRLDLTGKQRVTFINAKVLPVGYEKGVYAVKIYSSRTGEADQVTGDFAATTACERLLSLFAGVVWGGGSGYEAAAGDFISSMLAWGDVRDIAIQLARLTPGGDDPQWDEFGLSLAGVIATIPGVGTAADSVISGLKVCLKALKRIASPAAVVFRRLLAAEPKRLMKMWLDNDASFGQAVSELGDYLAYLITLDDSKLNKVAEIVGNVDLLQKSVRLNRLSDNKIMDCLIKTSTDHGKKHALKALDVFGNASDKIAAGGDDWFEAFFNQSPELLDEAMEGMGRAMKKGGDARTFYTYLGNSSLFTESYDRSKLLRDVNSLLKYDPRLYEGGISSSLAYNKSKNGNNPGLSFEIAAPARLLSEGKPILDVGSNKIGSLGDGTGHDVDLLTAERAYSCKINPEGVRTAMRKAGVDYRDMEHFLEEFHIQALKPQSGPMVESGGSITGVGFCFPKGTEATQAYQEIKSAADKLRVTGIDVEIKTIDF